MRSKIAVIGEKESVLGFKAVGFEVHEVTDSGSVEALVASLAQKDYGVIFITEKTLEPVMHILDGYKERRIPAIIPIPGREGSLGLGMMNVKKSVERAIGADILFKD